MFDASGTVYAAAAIAIFAAAVLPRMLSRVSISMPLVCLLAGAAVFGFLGDLPPRTRLRLRRSHCMCPSYA